MANSLEEQFQKFEKQYDLNDTSQGINQLTSYQEAYLAITSTLLKDNEHNKLFELQNKCIIEIKRLISLHQNNQIDFSEFLKKQQA